MKLLFTLILLLVHLVATEVLAEQPQKAVLPQKAPPTPAATVKKTSAQPRSTTAPATKTAPVTSPTSSPKTNPKSIKENQYSLDKDNKITIFKTTLYDELLLSEHCFPGQNLGDKTIATAKLKKPTCMAYTKSLGETTEKPEDKLETEFHNNLGSVHCKLMGGIGLIAKSYQNGESDFCLFKDGSMVSSWSSYYKSTHRDSDSTDKKNK